MKQQRPYPRVVVTRKAAKALAGGHLWVFEGEVIRVEPSAETGQMPANGDVVDVFEENGTWQGMGLLSQLSKIRVRIISRNANDRVGEAFWARKLDWAWKYRTTVLGGRSLPGCEPDTSCCRVLFSEADGFPGLIVDKYEDVLVSQVGTVGMERLKGELYPLLLKTLRDSGEDVRAIYERNDTASRELEGLSREKGWWKPSAQLDDGKLSPVGQVSGSVLQRSGDALVNIPESAVRRVRENGITYEVDLENSQKTGFFLDQKYNRRAVRRIARGRRVLDCFSHVGPFGLNAAAGGAEFVRCVDVSQTACDLAAANARLNGFEGVMGFTCADVLDYLPSLRNRKRMTEEGGPFDLIVLDPPAFTKSRSTARAAERGYREINQAALRLLPRGGYLATCSCSHFMPAERLANIVAEAAHATNVQLKQVEARQQAPDHPILVGVPETDYLKFFVYQVV